MECSHAVVEDGHQIHFPECHLRTSGLDAAGQQDAVEDRVQLTRAPLDRIGSFALGFARADVRLSHELREAVDHGQGSLELVGRRCQEHRLRVLCFFPRRKVLRGAHDAGDPVVLVVPDRPREDRQPAHIPGLRDDPELR